MLKYEVYKKLALFLKVWYALVMKKILGLVLIFCFTCGACFAKDVIYDSKGSKITGKIEGVTDGLIQIKNNGNIVTLIRNQPHHLYKDAVFARKRLISRQIIKYTGDIVFTDSSSVSIMCAGAKVVIPRYRVQKLELYLP